jgi:uncharacterized protein (DUF488 family)
MCREAFVELRAAIGRWTARAVAFLLSETYGADSCSGTVRSMSSPRLVSIGYEGRTAEDLVDELTQQGVQVLVDVRLTPLSRKPGLSKRRLAERLAEVGIDYLHLKALGNPKENRQPFWDGRVTDGCAAFGELLDSDEPQAALQTIADLTVTGTVAILCFERDHERCHRQVVTDRVTDRLPGGRAVVYA